MNTQVPRAMSYSGKIQARQMDRAVVSPRTVGHGISRDTDSQAHYSKQRIDPLFDGLDRRTYQYVRRRIRKYDRVLFKKFKLRDCFLFNQQKEASELKNMYRLTLFIIYAKYNCVYRVEIQLTQIQQRYIHSLTWCIRFNPRVAQKESFMMKPVYLGGSTMVSTRRKTLNFGLRESLNIKLSRTFYSPRLSLES